MSSKANPKINIYKPKPIVPRIKNKVSVDASSDDYWYIAYIILGLILLVLTGVLIYYIFIKSDKDTSISTSNSATSVTTSATASATTVTKSGSMPKPTSNLLFPTKNPNVELNNILRKQVKEWGEDYDSFPDERKNKIRNCYKKPEECSF
jgi:hypothetical protein